MKTGWFRTMAAAAMTALTFGFAPKAEAATATATVQFRQFNTTTKNFEIKKIGEGTDIGVTQYELVNYDMTADITSWPAGWYVVEGTHSSKNITISGNVHLILKDGCALTATAPTPSATASGKAGISVNENASLTIYAQSTGDNKGALIAKGSEGGLSNGSNWLNRYGGGGPGIGGDCNGKENRDTTLSDNASVLSVNSIHAHSSLIAHMYL